MSGLLSYAVPEALVGKVQRGSLVSVPLRGAFLNGIVIELTDRQPSEYKLKYIRALLQDQQVLTDDLIELAYWMSAYYCAGMQSIFEAMVPAVVRKGKDALTLKEISLAKTLSEDELEKLKRRAPVQATVYETLQRVNEPILRSALIKLANVSDAAIVALVKKEIAKETDKIISRNSYDDNISNAEKIGAEDHNLNGEQAAALDAIAKDTDSKTFNTHLLFGVTGSGKTEVYMQAMRRVLLAGGSCIFLVPEISLTPQTVGRLRSRLGNCGTELVVWHSGLSDGQRLDAWRHLAEGKARIVVGARSCIFAPIKNPELIIVDEEHDGAYKQDNNPRYNARDIAVYRAKLANSTCVLGSATPSLETLHNVRQNKYKCSKITKRIDGAALPKMFIANMLHEKAGSVLSNLLVDKMISKFEKGEQSMLFLNRRGYSKIFECNACGDVLECPHCAITLTLHKNERRLKCHLCGFEKHTPVFCEKCGSPDVKTYSFGTQKIEELVQKILPNARIGRMDADTMRHRDDYRKVLADFRQGRLDILIGTQMIAKGLDFPNVTLVGIINADISLNIPDFRSAERTFQLIVQVAGRSGRGNARGDVVIQTKNPDEPPIVHAQALDMEAFLEGELANRIEHGFPPAVKLVRHIFKSKSLQKLEFYTEEWAKKAEQNFGNICQIRGPIPAPIEKIEDFYRYQIWYFCSSSLKLSAAVSKLKNEFIFDPDVKDIVDVDPYDLS